MASVRLEALAALARLALGRDDLGLTGRFADFAEARLPDERVVDRRKPFVRLLLMCEISKYRSPSEPLLDLAELNIALLSKSTSTRCLRAR